MLLTLIIAALLASSLAILRLGPSRAALQCYLPVMLLWPAGYGWRFHGVLIDVVMAAGAPFIFVLGWQQLRERRFSLSDALCLLYAGAVCASSGKAENASAAEAALVSTLWAILPPYLIGRLLIRSAAMRERFARRVAFLFFIVSVLAVYEYRMTSNPYRVILSKLGLPQSDWGIQVRWGYGRISGPYGHAILAGALLSCGLLLSLWLWSSGGWGRKFRGLSWLPGSKGAYVTAGILGGLLMTQSRGPWMGAAFGLLLFFTSRAKRVRHALLRNALIAAALFGVFAFYTNRYTDITSRPVNQDQQNAVYRRELLKNYLPVVDRGGLLGWGRFFPRIDRQSSIDNEYLEVALVEGYLGLSCFVLLVLTTGWLMVQHAIRARTREEIGFYFCLLGMFVSIALTVTTVYLGGQLFSFFFLLVGWAQASRPARAFAAESAYERSPRPQPRFAFRRVFN